MLSKKQKVWHAVIFVMLLLLCVAGVNYYVDSYAQLRITYKDIAAQMDKGKNVLGLTESRGNERYLAYAVIEEMEEPFECIVLGSSLSMIYGKEHFGMEDSFYNFCLSGGSLEDYYGILGYLEHRDMLPNRIVMEIGGPLFNADDIAYDVLQDGRLYLENVIAGEEAECITPNVGRQLQKVLAIDYVNYNLQCLMQGQRFQVFYTDDTLHPTMAVKMADGSTDFSMETLARDSVYVDEAVRKAIDTRNLYKIEGYMQMSEGKISRFEQLVEFLRGRGVEISFFLPPYEEKLYSYIVDTGAYNGVLSTEEYIVNYAKEKGIMLYGSFSPEGCGLKSEDMVDASHMRREVAAKAFYLR